eukprot:scaffold8275_cov61-Phaeocystis_antarctica.AAC.3
MCCLSLSCPARSSHATRDRRSRDAVRGEAQRVSGRPICLGSASLEFEPCVAYRPVRRRAPRRIAPACTCARHVHVHGMARAGHVTCCTGGDAANVRARSTCAGLSSASKCTYEEEPRPTRLHIGRWARAELTMRVPRGTSTALRGAVSWWSRRRRDCERWASLPGDKIGSVLCFDQNHPGERADVGGAERVPG